MQLESVFLEKNAQQKIALLRVLCQRVHSGITIADLATQLGFTYQRTYNLFQELNADLADLYQKTPTAMRKSLVAASAQSVSLDRYKIQQFQAATAWQFFDYAVQGHQPSLDRFCEDHFLSRSTLMRKTANLRAFLAHYDLKLLYPTLTFSGPEARLRLLLQQCYWQVTQGACWPFTAISESDLKRQYQQFPRRHENPLAQHMDLYLLAVSRLRMAHGNALEHQIAHLLPDVNAYFSANQFPQLTPQQLVFENQFIAFHQAAALRFGHIGLNAWTRRKERLTLATPIAAKVLSALQRDLLNPNDPGHVALQTDLGLQLNLLRVLVCFFSLGGDYCKASDFDAPVQTTVRLNQLSMRAYTFVTNLPDTPEYAALHSATHAFCRFVTYVLAPTINAFDQAVRLKVAVILEPNDLLHRRLNRFLDNMSFVDRLAGPDALQQCDFLITEVSMLITPQTQAFITNYPQAYLIWDLDANAIDYHHLHQKLIALRNRRLVALSPSLAPDA